MVSLPAALSWQPAELRQLSQSLHSCSRSLSDTAEETAQMFSSLSDAAFAGLNRQAAAAAVSQQVAALRRGAVSLARLAGVAEDTAAELGDAVARLRVSVSAARNAGFIVADSGAVLHFLGFLPPLVPAVRVLAAVYQHAIVLALQQVAQVDSAAAAVMGALQPVAAGGVGRGSGAGVGGAAGGGSGGAGGPAGAAGGGAGGLPGNGGPGAEVAAAAAGLGLGSPVLLESSHNHSAIAFGDVSTADTVITFVPGTHSSAAEVEAQLPRLAALAEAAPEGEVAVVLFSYEAPPDLFDATSGRYHDRAAERLQQLQSNLVELAAAQQTTPAAFSLPNGVELPAVAEGSPPPDRQVTRVVAGYSYGATVASQATLGSGLYADRLLLVGSPGLGPGLEKPQQMRLLQPDGQAYRAAENAQRVAVATSPADPINAAAHLGVHGTNPTSTDFGVPQFDLSRSSQDYRKLWDEARESGDFGKVTNPHTTHYFGDQLFDREARRWLER